MAEVDKALKAGRPVSINYFVNRILAPDYQKSPLDKHASVIIGRKKVGRECIYVVKNSWGNACYPYRSDIHCNSQDGIVEFSAKDIERATTSINYLK